MSFEFLIDPQGGAKTSTAAHARRLRVRAGRHPARLPDRGGRPDARRDDRRVRAVLPAHGHRRPTTHQGSAAVHPGLPPDEGRRAATSTCSSCPTISGRTRLTPDVDAALTASRPGSPPSPGGILSASAPPLPPPATSAAARRPLTASGVRVLAGVPYAAIPGVRPLELDLWLPPCRRRPRPGRGLPARRRLAAGQPARRRARRYAGAVPNPFELVAPCRHRGGQHRLPALRRGDLARPAARRQGRRPLAARTGRRTRASTRTGSPPGASRPAVTSPSCSA